MGNKNPFMGTTEVPVEKTVAQITSALVQAGSRSVNTDYENREVAAIRFTLEVKPGLVRPFALPARVDPVFTMFQKRRKSNFDRQKNADRDRDQAKRTAWRQLLRWVEAQLAMVQCGMADAGEVFLPYTLDDTGQHTLYQVMKETNYQLFEGTTVKRLNAQNP